MQGGLGYGKIFGTMNSKIITVLGVFGVFACGWFSHEFFGGLSAAREMGNAAEPTVAVGEVALRPVNPVEWYIGHVEPVQEVDILPQIDGYLKEVRFAEGDMVKEGDVLFVIDDERYVAADAIARAALARAEANVKQAEADVDKAERYWKRLTTTDERGITQTEKDAAETGLASEKAELASAKAAVKEAQAQIAASEFNLKHTVIHAPITGRIGKTFMHTGDYVAPSMGRLAHLVQTDPIRVGFTVTDRDYLALRQKAGKRGVSPAELLRLRLRMPDGSTYPSVGRWSFADNEMSAESATVTIRADFDNAAGTLLPKAYVEVLTDEVKPEEVPSVPLMSLAHGAVANGLWTVDDKNAVTLHEVKTGRQDGEFVEILDGVKPGARIVTQGVSNLAAGMRVRVVPAMDLGSTEERK